MSPQNRQADRNGNRSAADQPADSARSAADRLYRTATECVRQRERYARLVAAGAMELEQRAALRVACLCDVILHESIRAYEKGLAGEGSRSSDGWRPPANSLWHASREYERRHQDCDESSRQITSRKPHKFKELAVQYDLEASALLALRLALAAYRKVCPECALEDGRQTFVA
jgi:hypothetical protein